MVKLGVIDDVSVRGFLALPIAEDPVGRLRPLTAARAPVLAGTAWLDTAVEESVLRS